MAVDSSARDYWTVMRRMRKAVAPERLNHQIIVDSLANFGRMHSERSRELMRREVLRAGDEYGPG